MAKFFPIALPFPSPCKTVIYTSFEKTPSSCDANTVAQCFFLGGVTSVLISLLYYTALTG